MIIKLRWTQRGEKHRGLMVFVGVDGDHLANAGELCLRVDEAVKFRVSIRQGSGIEGSGGIDGVLESGWSTADEAAGGK